MKHKICISVDEATLQKVMDTVRSRQFRNKSHAFEYAVKEVMGR